MAAHATFSLVVLVVATLVSRSLTHPEYRVRIPNAMNVNGHEAIGHVDKGHGSRNAFGKDFASAGKKWTVALCQKDSDGDGQTNGQELGDPCCQWVQNSNEKTLWIEGVSAPGDATSKSDPARWANVTCPPLPPTEAPSVAATGASAAIKVSVMAMWLVVAVAVMST